MRDQPRHLAYRWIFPIAQLLVCAVVLWPIRSEFYFEIRAAIRAYIPARTLENKPRFVLPYAFDLNLDDPPVRRSLKNAERRLWTPSVLNLPVMMLVLPYVILNPATTEWVPKGMDSEWWRAISWPFVGLIFWWIAGRGLEALLSARQSAIHPPIGWVETVVGILVLAVGLFGFIGALVVRRRDSDFPWVLFRAAGAIWAVLGSSTVAARVAQWRIRLRHRDAKTAEALFAQSGMSYHTPWRVLKLMALGAFSFWLPDTLLHAVRGFRFAWWDVWLITIVMPLTFLGAYLLKAKLYRRESRRCVVGLLIAGVWLLGGLFMSVGASFSGGGFVGPDGLLGATKLILFSLVPMYTFVMATYDGSLLALLIVSGAALVMVVVGGAKSR